MNRIAILLTCFNRRETTISCLKALDQQLDLNDIEFKVYLVDDGSTDDTAKAVKTMFPSVELIKGTGNLFWNGGMRLSWQHALLNNYDFYLWLNDDSHLYNDSISKIIASYSQLSANGEKIGAVLGTMVDPSSGKSTYGGRLRTSQFNLIKFGKIVEPTDEPQLCHFVNGNFTLVPSEAVSAIGILSDAYTHSMGDFDYGLRLQKVGFTCWIAPGVYGECENNSQDGGCKDNSLTIAERKHKMLSITQLPPANEWMHFVKLHGGPAWPYLWFKAWLRKKFPALWVVIIGKNVKLSEKDKEL